ncbi:hypothetical protein [Desulfuromonas sp. CSMB_57]|jgi:hypothetical protein|uniref:hypothetical protein n=1 Tax=Desulfuromonas sp. CSMB_57 TaxID=2807629 RepID=UPI001CD5D2F2|nr:hypothetical protein [Desulfuromonas sp. CSMB_57]
MLDICPLCGRTKCTQDYPPAPCAICEDEFAREVWPQRLVPRLPSHQREIPPGHEIRP